MGCSHEFTAAHSSGIRTESDILWIVVHDEEALTARSAASWFANPASAGSAHKCVDDKECYTTLGDLVIPWAASNSNTNGLHLEQAGYAAWPRWRWIKRMRTLNRGARVAARWSLRYDIPVRWLDAHDLHNKVKGFTDHRTVSRYTALYGLSGDRSHTDPGPGWPRKRWMRLVRVHKRFMRAH